MLEFTTRAPGGGRTAATPGATLLDVGAVDRDYPELRDRAASPRPAWPCSPSRHARAARPDDDVGAAAAAAAAPHGRVHLPAAADRSRRSCWSSAWRPVYAWVDLLPRRVLASGCASPTSCWCCPTPTARSTPGCAPSTSRPWPRRPASLGASWFTVMWRIILPNIRTAVLSAAFLVGGAGARRVHHRQPAQPQQPPGRRSTCSASATPRSRSPSRSPRCVVRLRACCSPCPSSAAGRRARRSTAEPTMPHRPRDRPRRPPPPRASASA